MPMDSAIVLGVGAIRGMGAQLALRFAGHGLHVVVGGRTQEKLDAVVAAIKSAGGEATALVTDATSEADCQTLFAKAASTGPIKLAIFNAGNNTPGRIEEMSAEFFEASWRLCCFGGFLFGREAVKHMKPAGGGAILFTGASASLRGRVNFGAFNSSKSALRTFAQALAKEHGVDGIHVGHVVIDGAINGDIVNTRYPDYANSVGEAGLLKIEAIVDAYDYLWRQPRGGWTFEVDVRTAVESW